MGLNIGKGFFGFFFGCDGVIFVFFGWVYEDSCEWMMADFKWRIRKIKLRN